MSAKKFREKDPVEYFPLTFNFTGLLGAGATIDAASIAVATMGDGTADATPDDLIMGSLQIVGTKVLQKVHNGVAGANYALRCQVDSGGNRFVLPGILPVRNAV